MCGIIGYAGAERALPHLLEGLGALEYRGYDSAGVAVALPAGAGNLTVKARGKLAQLQEKLKTHPEAETAHSGIGHTRWATHGAPTDVNAHPHATERLALVHNGIIENDAALRKTLADEGTRFLSETDTEVAALLLDRAYAESGDPVAALFRTADLLRGSFAFAVLYADRPDAIYAIRRDSPLIVAEGDHGSVLASDIPALLRHSRACIRLPEETVAVLQRDRIDFFDRAGTPLTLPAEQVDWTVEKAQKGRYPHFMRKEIDEQPEALHRTVAPRLRGGLPYFDLPELDTDRILRFQRIHMVACGTAMHAGMIGKRVIEKWARLPAQVEIASEFRYRDPILDPERDLCILLSQSGETADTLAALRHAKERGVTTLAIVNVVGSTVAREADHALYTLAGPEIAVASTKAYSVQCALLTLLAIRLAHAHGRMSEEEARRCAASLRDDLPAAVASALAMDSRIAAVAKRFAHAEHLFFIGRRTDAHLCTEGSLKLKEISYVHSEAYPAGELKHGTISLIVEGTPVIALLTDPDLSAKTLSAIREVTSRGARVLAIATEEIAREQSIPCEALLTLPDTPPHLALFPAVTVLQLLAYHTAVARGCEVDQPRNLAKSVTVE